MTQANRRVLVSVLTADQLIDQLQNYVSKHDLLMSQVVIHSEVSSVEDKKNEKVSYRKEKRKNGQFIRQDRPTQLQGLSLLVGVHHAQIIQAKPMSILPQAHRRI